MPLKIWFGNILAQFINSKIYFYNLGIYTRTVQYISHVLMISYLFVERDSLPKHKHRRLNLRIEKKMKKDPGNV